MYTRKCPNCENEISYKSEISLNNAIKKETICFSCNGKKNGWSKVNKKRIGENNPFYGKNHSIETKNKISNKNKGKIYSEEVNKKKALPGSKNGMFGKSIYEVWVEKYGEEVANKKREDWKFKISKKNKGEGNPMYGKPVPKKSGNGISGWYKDFYFRSLHELKFILICERFKINCVSAENLRFLYESYDGNKRTYSPDFLVEDKYIVEVKPKKLQGTPLNKLKFEAAKKYCKENNLRFKILDFGILTQNELDQLVKNKKIKLNECIK